MAISWTEDLNTGIDAIDAQHRQIVDYINQLEDAIERRDDPQVGQVLQALVAYTLSHFAFEESLMQEADFKYAKVHKSLHETFTHQVNDFQHRYRAGEDVAGALQKMLSFWLVSHIKREDQAYAAAVGEHMRRLTRDTQEGGWLRRALGRFFK